MHVALRGNVHPSSSSSPVAVANDSQSSAVPQQTGLGAMPFAPWRNVHPYSLPPHSLSPASWPPLSASQLTNSPRAATGDTGQGPYELPARRTDSQLTQAVSKSPPLSLMDIDTSKFFANRPMPIPSFSRLPMPQAVSRPPPLPLMSIDTRTFFVNRPAPIPSFFRSRLLPAPRSPTHPITVASSTKMPHLKSSDSPHYLSAPLLSPLTSPPYLIPPPVLQHNDFSRWYH